MSKNDNNNRERNLELDLIAFKSPKSTLSEAFRVLRTNLGFAGMDRPFRTVLITSSLAQEGKSTVAANLAVVTAQAGYKVMLVDCDLRKPVQHKIFQIPNNTGFSNCILNQLDPEQAAYDLTLPNLKVLTTGPMPPNPAEILNSARTKALWDTLKSQYDFIFIDSPPLIAVTDASIIASQVDGTLLVVRSGKTRIDVARLAQDRMVKANTRMVGVVLNQVKMDKRSHNEYYY